LVVVVETVETIRILHNRVDQVVAEVMETVLQLLLARELVPELLCRVMAAVDSLEAMVQEEAEEVQVRLD
jgi:hypothetical protein